MSELAKWDNFYVIIGSAAGALIGLQFVVLTLLADRPHEGNAEAGAAFGTPTIIHFSATLFLSAFLQAPWESFTIPAVLFGLLGIAGVLYTIIVMRRMHHQSAYDPVFEDWFFHFLLPLVAYALLALSAVAAFSHLRGALFGLACACLMLLFDGIHNAWDNVSYHVLVKMGNAAREAIAQNEQSQRHGGT
jgi:hypothetical protein